MATTTQKLQAVIDKNELALSEIDMLLGLGQSSEVQSILNAIKSNRVTARGNLTALKAQYQNISDDLTDYGAIFAPAHPFPLDESDDIHLLIISAVQQAAIRLHALLSECTSCDDESSSPEQTFKRVMGPLEFWWSDTAGFSSVDATAIPDKQVITLAQSAFYSNYANRTLYQQDL